MDEMEVNQGDGRPPLAKAAFDGALLITALSIIFTMVLYLLDLHLNQWLGYLTFVVIFTALFLVGKKYRDTGGRRELTYGKAFKFLFFTTLFVALLTAVFNFVYFTWIAPEIIDFAIDDAYDRLLDSGMGEEQAQKSMEMQVPWMNNWTFAVGGIFATLFWGTIAALIMAAILKRESKSL